MSRFKVTQSLLSGFDWVFRKEDGYADFLRTLRREPVPQTAAMLDGIQFEGMVSAAWHGSPPEPDHPWYDYIVVAARILEGSAEQVYGEGSAIIGEDRYVLHGVADNLKRGIIYDTKYSHKYTKFPKYYNSPQHPAYFAIWPQSIRFEYVIFTGSELLHETYYPFATESFWGHVDQMIRWLKQKGIFDLYAENWEV